MKTAEFIKKFYESRPEHAEHLDTVYAHYESLNGEADYSQFLKDLEAMHVKTENGYLLHLTRR